MKISHNMLHESNEAMDNYLFILLFVSNFITSCLFLYYAYEVRKEVTKSGKNSSLTKEKEKSLHEVILIQFIINLVFNVITQYRTYMRSVFTSIIWVRSVFTSIIWAVFPLAYYLLALLWEKGKIKTIGEYIVLWIIWIVFFIFLNAFAFSTMIAHI